MATGGEGGAVQDEVGGVLRCSVTQPAGGISGGCAVHPAPKPRGASLQAIQPTSILTRKLFLVVACRSCRVEDQLWEGLPRGSPGRADFFLDEV